MESLNTIGILGGMSSAATGEYYNLINQKVKSSKGGHTIAELIICSVNFANIERFVRAQNWTEAGAYLAEKAKRVENAGADCLFLATNTLHRVREDIKSAISIPFIDIFETVSKEIKVQGKTKIGILGTYPVMTDSFYVEAYRDVGVDLVGPTEEEKREIDRIIFDEMTHHKFLPSSKDYFIRTIKNLADRGAEGIILGCTEIKMLINQNDIPQVPLFDTTDLHCEMAAKICTGEVALNGFVL
ncbi:MAG: aspartate/glutamate racemase family protein [Flavobacteriaceae bacterium]